MTIKQELHEFFYKRIKDLTEEAFGNRISPIDFQNLVMQYSDNLKLCLSADDSVLEAFNDLIFPRK